MYIVGDLAQILMFSPDELPENTPPISQEIFRTLKNAHPESSAHTKPVTTGCGEAILVRVTNERTVGVDSATEVKGRMFMTTDIEGTPILSASFYLADSMIDGQRFKQTMPVDNKGRALINVPHSISARKNGSYDIGDEVGTESIFTQASEALGIGMGMVNLHGILILCKTLGVRAFITLDKRLVERNEPVTTNIGDRRLGTYFPSGKVYCDSAIAQIPNLHIAGTEVRGYAIGNFAARSPYKESPALLDLYRSDNFLQRALIKEHTRKR
jgi:hypothetical protein